MDAKRTYRTNGTSKAETITIRLRPGDTPEERIDRLNHVIGVYGAKRTLEALSEAMRARGGGFERHGIDLADNDRPHDAAYAADLARRFLTASDTLAALALADMTL